MRNLLSLALVACVSFLPASSVAVSLGKMITRSALNERFQADIELEATDVGDLDSLQVSLASQSDFTRAGLERSFLLTKLRFKVMQSETGRPIVRVTSRGLVQEPFLDFLLEINWPRGRVLKHFTALLDPKDRPRPRIIPPTVRTTAAVTPKPNLAQVAVPEIAGRYGPVKEGATLRSIARSLAARDAKVNQVALALFRNNPSAFVGGNMNGLKAGAVLVVPKSDVALFRASAIGSATYASQDGAKPATKRTGNRNSVRIVPPGGEGAIAGNRGGGLQDEPPEVKQLRADLRLAQVTIETNRKDTEGLRSELQELRAQLNALHQGVGKKLDALQIPEAAPAVVSQPPAPETQALAHNTEAQQPTLPQNQPPPPATVKTIPPAKERPVPPVPVAPVASPPDSWFALPDFELPSFSIPELQFPDFSWPSLELPDLRLPELGGLLPGDAAIDKNLNDPVYQAVAGGLLLIILTTLGSLWLLRRRSVVEARQGMGEDSSDLIAPDSSITSSDIMDSARTSTLTQKPEKLDETSFLSDFSASDMDELQQETGQADPAAEADVYIAYGRYQQAEMLLREVLEKTPERNDIKIKLLNVLHTQRNTAAFTALVEEMDAAGFAKSDPRSWEIVCAMGQDLIPGHRLFGMADHKQTEPRRVIRTNVPQQLREIDFDESSLDSSDTVLSEMPIPKEFEVSAITPKLSAVQSVVTAPSVVNKSPPFPNNEPSRPAAVVIDKDAEEQQDSVSQYEPDDIKIDISDLFGSDGVYLDNLDVGSESSVMQGSAGAGSATLTKKPQNNMASFVDDSSNFIQEYYDLESELDSSIALPDMSEDISLNELSSMSNASGSIETQLDLAKVYVEMGMDNRMVQDMLEEVLQKGNSIQQKTARDMLASIGS